MYFLQAKSVEAVEEEIGMAKILGRRVDHLKEGCSPDSRWVLVPNMGKRMDYLKVGCSQILL